MHETCHLRLKINIMVPTNLYAVNKFEQNDQNDDATHLLYFRKNLGRYVNPKSIYWCQIHKPICQNFKMKYMINNA